MKPKNQRLVLILLALVAVTAAVLLAMWGLRDRASYFYTPADIVAGKAAGAGDRTVRLGGMVQKGSLVRAADGVSVRFTVIDGDASTPVTYRGILPDLFREGSGVVAEGRLSGATFTADTILAKHDERYMPPQMGNQKAEHRVGRTVVK
ncbi:MAG: cytochrome c maturation protein CcmE [Sphingomicrobium sp.]